MLMVSESSRLTVNEFHHATGSGLHSWPLVALDWPFLMALASKAKPSGLAFKLEQPSRTSHTLYHFCSQLLLDLPIRNLWLGTCLKA